MPVRKLVLLTLAVTGALLLGTAALRAGSSAAPATAWEGSQPTGQCAIAGFAPGEVPPFQAAAVAELLPEQMPGLRRAYFSMGCFWGSEAMLASCPGVLFTRVGFSGGSFPDPSYSAIGDHVETVEVLFDPDQLSYGQLLDYFWDHHNAHAKPIFRQYASAVFTTDPEQERVARLVRKQRQARAPGEPLLTALQALERFYPAEESHQKYYLSQDPELLERLPCYAEQKLQTRLATKLNALVGRAGKQSELTDQLTALGLSAEQCQALFRRASWPH